METNAWWRPTDTLYNFIMQCAKKAEKIEGKPSGLIKAQLDEVGYFTAGAKHGGFKKGIKGFQMGILSRNLDKGVIEDIVNKGIENYGGKTRIEVYNWNGTTNSNFQLLLEDNEFVSGGKTSGEYNPWGVGALSGFAIDAGLSLVRIKSWQKSKIFRNMKSRMNFDISIDREQEKGKGNIYGEVILWSPDMDAIEGAYTFLKQMQVNLKGNDWEIK